MGKEAPIQPIGDHTKISFARYQGEPVVLAETDLDGAKILMITPTKWPELDNRYGTPQQQEPKLSRKLKWLSGKHWGNY